LSGFAIQAEEGGAMAANFSKKLIVEPGEKVDLSKWDADETLGWRKNRKTEASLEKTIAKMDNLQYVMYAERKRALLVVFQGLDAAGKDGTIRKVMSGLNPQGCSVTSFKTPSAEEAAHDFLWRVHAAVPKIGYFGIFNRSHYEDVLVARVHNLVPKEVWSKRYDQINSFEAMLSKNHVKILKFFLHISKDEQKKRFLERLDDPDKQWKLSEADFIERKYWNDYKAAYEAALRHCSTAYAPWYVIPANKKWFRNLAVSQIIVENLEAMKLKFPAPTIDIKKLKWS
jgi:PPK2 family polyphosphate:nucleotide phosphotransferase